MNLKNPLYKKTLYTMAHKITVKYLKAIVYNQIKMHQTKKGLRVYARALVNVADTVDIIFAKFAWTIIDIGFFQSTFKSRRSKYCWCPQGSQCG